ncbi:hypothetical protein [Streptomyces sp. NBC_00576]|uniref:hypothetical protein n=1 Tax=Streptomyces sp. NBC_00576 TaxID=2903665 RepID=UPI002E7FD33F|nr:hypothetical protein [Streptomyces sp. NBC_00576]WUB70994.1 hypothetical protein OG734_13365 [Streptomyces sp. NBC_00576]
MSAADELSRALVTGTFLGVGAGSPLAEVENRLGVGVRQIHGRKPNRFLRVDFGLVEVTFDGESERLCRWLTIHLHRLDDVPGMAVEVLERYDLDFSGAVTWGQLSAEVRHAAEPVVPPTVEGLRPPVAPLRYRIPTVKATVHLSQLVEGDERSRVIEMITIGV